MDNRLFFDITARAYDWLTDQEIWREQIREVLGYLPQKVVPTSEADQGCRGESPAGVWGGAPSLPSPSPSPARILDLGCGPGVSAFALAAACPRASVVGIDISPRMVERARRHHRRDFPQLDNVGFEVGDATALRFAEGEFDLAVGHSFLYLVPDPAAVLAEARRLLGPGGTLVLLEPNRAGSLPRSAWARFGRDLAGARFADVFRFSASLVLWRVVSGSVGRLDSDVVERWLREAGFDEARTVPTLGGLGVHCIGRVGNRGPNGSR